MYQIIFIVVLFSLTGCEGLNELGAPWPKNGTIMWKKNSVSTIRTQEEVRDCRERNINREIMSSDERIDFSDACMLQKGFQFIPKVNGYMNVCFGGSRDRIACKSTRGEYTVSPLK